MFYSLSFYIFEKKKLNLLLRLSFLPRSIDFRFRPWPDSSPNNSSSSVPASALTACEVILTIISSGSDKTSIFLPTAEVFNKNAVADFLQTADVNSDSFFKITRQTFNFNFAETTDNHAIVITNGRSFSFKTDSDGGANFLCQ